MQNKLIPIPTKPPYNRGLDENPNDPLFRDFELTNCTEKLLEISIFTGRKYKDGTRQRIIYLRIPTAESSEIITLAKVRGSLKDAQRKAEEILFGTAATAATDKSQP